MRSTTTLLIGLLCVMTAAFAVKGLSQTRSSGPSTTSDSMRRMEERKRLLASEAAQRAVDPNSERIREELDRKKARRLSLWHHSPEQLLRESQERTDKIRAEFLREKASLSPTPQQWEVIRPLLERIRTLRDQPRSTYRLSMTASTSTGKAGQGRSVGRWRWNRDWDDTPEDQWTRAQHDANELLALVEAPKASDEALDRKMAALRESRRMEAASREEKKIDEAIAEAQRQLRQTLNTRQEAALVLMRWL